MKHQPYPAAERFLIHGAGIQAAQQDISCDPDFLIFPEHAVQALQQGGFAAAGGPQYGGDAPGGHCHGKVCKGGLSPVENRKIPYFQHGGSLCVY